MKEFLLIIKFFAAIGVGASVIMAVAAFGGPDSK